MSETLQHLKSNVFQVYKKNWLKTTLGAVLALMSLSSFCLSSEAQVLDQEAPNPLQPTILTPLNALYKLPPYVELTPFRPTNYEMNLWRIEANLFRRSPVVLSPDGAGVAYTEVTYQPGQRQVSGRLYWVPIETMPAYRPELVARQPGLANPDIWLSFLDTNRSMQLRELLWRVGDRQDERFGFQTLTVVDWSHSGQRLLVKKRTGVLYLGLKMSQPAIFDRMTGEVIQFGEIARAVNVHWRQKLKADSPVFQHAWQLEPLGWAPLSDTEFYLEGWSYSQNKKQQYLGLWKFNLDTNRPELISESPGKVRLASNGFKVSLKPALMPEPYRSQYLVEQPEEVISRPVWWKPTTWFDSSPEIEAYNTKRLPSKEKPDRWWKPKWLFQREDVPPVY
jgi:hypothetical protein